MAKKFPDLTGDGKVTQKDILKGRGIKLQSGGRAAAKYPEKPRNKDVTLTLIEKINPIRQIMLRGAKKMERDRFEKESEEYVDSLKKMGMFDEGGGRANVPAKKTKKRKHKSTDKPIKVADGGRVTTFRNGGAAITKTNQKPHMS
jgi:hypothetical protein|tara:strand:+ start:60 stop:494 length:435 start_codon:yes stop_codon:yes gene_type:complete